MAFDFDLCLLLICHVHQLHCHIHPCWIGFAWTLCAVLQLLAVGGRWWCPYIGQALPLQAACKPCRDAANSQVFQLWRASWHSVRAVCIVEKLSKTRLGARRSLAGFERGAQCKLLLVTTHGYAWGCGDCSTVREGCMPYCLYMVRTLTRHTVAPQQTGGPTSLQQAAARCQSLYVAAAQGSTA